MGYELLFHYHDRLEEGGYDRDEMKTYKKKVGDPFEDVPLERVAGAIMGQLSRRDVWVVDVEVFEYSKKKVTFRETKGGIIVKNKKFLVDTEAGSLVVSDLQEAPQPGPQHSSQQHSHSQPSPVGFHPHNNNQLRPMRWVTFLPEPQMMLEIKQRGLRLTVDKKYPVFKERMHPTGIGMAMTTLDDSGREIEIADKYFVPADVTLVADREAGFSETPRQREGGKLLWGNTIDEPDMPKLR